MSSPTYKYRVDISYMFWSNYKVQYNLFQKKNLIALRKEKCLEHAYCSRVTDWSQINKKMWKEILECQP
jgi:predicted Zn-dependent protease